MKALVLLMLLATPALAAKRPEPDYQDAILKSFHTVPAGQHCSGNTNGTVSDSGVIDATTSTNCSNSTRSLYTVVIGEQTFVITPTLSAKGTAGAIFSFGYSEIFKKNSCLYGQLPGAHVLIRSENGMYHVKVGKRESLYRLVSAQ